MLVKWIKCLVESQNKNLFSAAQEQWQAVKGTEGFIAQTGGWNIHNDNEACILSIWRDHSSYLCFMQSVHDNILNNSGQTETYVSIAISLYDSMFEFSETQQDIPELIENSKLIRSTECTTYLGRQEQYIESQNTAWKPGMAEVNGMLGGYFTKRKEIESDFLVLTLWDSEKSHFDFVQNKLQILRVKAGMEKDMEKLTARIIRMEDSWTVY